MKRVAIPEAVRFMVDCLKAAGAGTRPAEQQACLLIQADICGHPSHGLNRLELYVNDIKSDICKPNNEPKILKETASTAWVDARNCLGSTSSHFAMDIAIKKAKNTGVGWVTVKGANHNGMIGYWAKLAADQGMVGMSFSNTFPMVTPTRSKEVALGTNPLAVVAPGSEGELFFFDIATAAVSFGKIEIQRRKGEPLPSGWAQDRDGNMTTDTEIAKKAKCLLPLGGTETTSGYKGYGLSATIDILTGISSGGNYGKYIPVWGEKPPRIANLGHCFVVVNPGCFAPGFGDRLTDSMRHWRNLKPVDPKLKVLAPGDKEKAADKENKKNGFVTYVDQQIESSGALAKRLKVKPMKLL